MSLCKGQEVTLYSVSKHSIEGTGFRGRGERGCRERSQKVHVPSCLPDVLPPLSESRHFEARPPEKQKQASVFSAAVVESSPLPGVDHSAQEDPLDHSQSPLPVLGWELASLPT